MDTPEQPETTTSPKTEPFAVVSLVASLLGPCLVFPAIFGIICGHIARGKIRRSEGRLAGDGLALASLILGYCTIFIMAASMLLVIPALGRARVRVQQQQEINQLKQLSVALIMYADTYDDHMPPDLGVLMDEGYINNGSTFVSPAQDTPPPQSGDDVRAGQTDFVYYPWERRLSIIERPQDVVTMHSKPTNFDDWTGVAFLDAHVQAIQGQTIEETARIEGWEIMNQP